ncbi:MAG TPA: hypothetical protein VGE52_11945 [Pirellulales bacterium]
MARPLSKIADFSFLALVGSVAHPQRRRDVVERPGVNGCGVWDMGLGCRPFTLVSARDVSTIDAGYTTYADYCALGDQEAVRLIQNGVDFHSLYELEYAVLAVELLENKRIRTPVGGFDEASEALLRCRWTLLPLLPRAT